MYTKTRKENKEKNDLQNNHSFIVPKKIKEKIDERGYYLYEWISEKEVKQSIQRDFLKYIKKLGTPLSIALIVPSMLLYLLGDIALFTYFFFGFLAFINIALVVFLTVLTVKRANILRNNAYVLLTDSSVSVNGKIRKLDSNKILSDKYTTEISKIFEEEIFEKSYIEKTKKGIFKTVLQDIGEGFKTIFKLGSSSRSSSRSSKGAVQLMLIGVILYSMYALSLGFIYFIGIFLIWIFGIIISIVNKKVLLMAGHQITSINNHFEDIDTHSKGLSKEKETLYLMLENALNNDWKDSLLKRINIGISNINAHADNAVNTSINLKKEIKSSKYSEMFNFNIYNSWIKKEILIPLEQIRELLNKNLSVLNENKTSIEEQIKSTTNDNLKGPLVASKVRIEMKIVEILKHKKGIEVYINKLK